jgi:cytidylate kinase
MIDLSPYPNNVGQFLNPNHNLFQLETKTIIRIFGLAGAGKGTLSKQLIDFYNIANLETSYILRSATWIYKQLKLDFNDINTARVFEQIKIGFWERELHFTWVQESGNEVKLTDNELRSNVVQESVAVYSGNPIFRAKYYEQITFILNHLIDSAVILDGRGSNTPYINQAEADGFKVIRIFLWANNQSNYLRYKNAYISRNKIENWNDLDEQNCKKEFQTNIHARNLQDYQNAVDNKMGLLTSDTGIIDTSGLKPTQVLQIAVDFIEVNKGNK